MILFDSFLQQHEATLERIDSDFEFLRTPLKCNYSGFEGYVHLGEFYLALMGGSSIHSIRGVEDAYQLEELLTSIILCSSDDDFSKELLTGLRCFSMQCFIERFGFRLKVSSNGFLIELPFSDLTISEFEEVNYPSYYTELLRSDSGSWNRALCFSGADVESRNHAATIMPEIFLNAMHVDRDDPFLAQVGAIDDFILTSSCTENLTVYKRLLSYTLGHSIVQLNNLTGWHPLKNKLVLILQNGLLNVETAVSRQILNNECNNLFEAVLEAVPNMESRFASYAMKERFSVNKLFYSEDLIEEIL